jgi:hypothetical protein
MHNESINSSRGLEERRGELLLFLVVVIVVLMCTTTMLFSIPFWATSVLHNYSHFKKLLR